ncbi:MAG: hypothetical protein LAO56_25890, partial [Acidobacteriia bacterium]|nr:hypothetical protein [Terriglobia bacterium]
DGNCSRSDRSTSREARKHIVLLSDARVFELDLFIQRTSPASFRAEYLLFGQVKLKYREFARLQHVPPAGVGQVISRQF